MIELGLSYNVDNNNNNNNNHRFYVLLTRDESQFIQNVITINDTIF